MKYKEGDKVRIKSLDWYNENKDEYGYVRLGDYLFTPDLAKYCGEEFTISHTTQFTLPTYVMIGNGHEWSDEMIEGLVGEDFYMEDDELEVEKDDIVWNLGDGKFRVFLPDGYEFIDENGNVINATKIVLEKKKSKYPKTYEECCEIMNTNKYWNLVYHTFPHFGNNDWTFASDNHYANSHLNSLNALHKLLICRDAYWKLAGDWKPDWLDDDVKKYVISCNRNYDTFGGLNYSNRILVFPTAEMRDAFYEYSRS